MIDDEIEQLAILKSDCDRLKHTLSNVKEIDRKYGESFNYQGLKEFIHPRVYLRRKVKEMLVDALSGCSAVFELKTDDYRNDIVKERIRRIEEEVFTYLGQKLYEFMAEMTEALENYKGEKVEAYIKETIKKRSDPTPKLGFHREGEDYDDE